MLFPTGAYDSAYILDKTNAEMTGIVSTVQHRSLKYLTICRGPLEDGTPNLKQLLDESDGCLACVLQERSKHKAGNRKTAWPPDFKGYGSMGTPSQDECACCSSKMLRKGCRPSQAPMRARASAQALTGNIYRNSYANGQAQAPNVITRQILLAIYNHLPIYYGSLSGSV